MQYLYTEGSYDKPFVTLYFQSSLFAIYLSGFIFWRPWQRLCCCYVWRRRRRRSRSRRTEGGKPGEDGRGEKEKLLKEGRETQEKEGRRESSAGNDDDGAEISFAEPDEPVAILPVHKVALFALIFAGPVKRLEAHSNNS